MPKMSIVVPVYYNAENLPPLYEDLKAKVLDAADFDIEVIFVDDGSGDNSYQVMRELARKDARIRIFHLSRNFCAMRPPCAAWSTQRATAPWSRQRICRNPARCCWTCTAAGKAAITWCWLCARGGRKAVLRSSLRTCTMP